MNDANDPNDPNDAAVANAPAPTADARDLLEKMPAAVDRDALGDTEATVQYNIRRPAYQVLRGGEIATFEGVAPEPDLTVTIEDEDLVGLFRGDVNPMTAFMTGRIRVEGDMGLAQRLVGFVDRDKLQELA